MYTMQIIRSAQRPFTKWPMLNYLTENGGTEGSPLVINPHGVWPQFCCTEYVRMGMGYVHN